MKYRIATIILGAATLIAPALAQQSPSPLQLPASLEKELGAHAANVLRLCRQKACRGCDDAGGLERAGGPCICGHANVFKYACCAKKLGLAAKSETQRVQI